MYHSFSFEDRISKQQQYLSWHSHACCPWLIIMLNICIIMSGLPEMCSLDLNDLMCFFHFEESKSALCPEAFGSQ